MLYGDGYATVCTRADDIWDTCVRADEQATTWAMVPAIHLDAARALEFWLLDDNADVSEPIGYLGTVNAPDDADHLRVMIAIGNINQLTDLPRTATGETGYVRLE